jgi:serine protease SohB
MIFIADYLNFLLKALTCVFALLSSVAGIMALLKKSHLGEKNTLRLKKLNTHYQTLADTLNQTLLTKKAYKQYKITQKRQSKILLTSEKKRIFVLDFQGDWRASAVTALRKMVTAILQVATSQDTVLVRLESAGGLVSAYGLAASQLQRLKTQKIPVLVSVDKIAASGGYLMACVADKILAAPFAIIGSIGVVAQLPNFHRFLKKHEIDFELLTAGEHKRTLTVFGENNPKARQKMQSELEEIHNIFKTFVKQHRPQVAIDQIATGEHWLASQALEKQLVDQLISSDDYLLQAYTQTDIYHITYLTPKSWTERLTSKIKAMGLSPSQLNNF